MKKTSLFIAIGFLAVSSMTTSCKKEKTSVEGLTDEQVADIQDNSVASAAFDDVDTELDEPASSGLKSGIDEDSLSRPEVKIRREKGKKVREITYDGKKSRNGKVRSGKIVETTTYTDGDSTNELKKVRTVTFENYYNNGRKVEGTKTITYMGKVDGVHPQWKIELVGGKVTRKNGNVVTLEFSKTRKMIEGYDTRFRSDDVFEINGQGSGVNKRGLAYTVTESNLIRKYGCPHYKSGTRTYVSEAKTVVVTYTGGDNCSPEAIVESDGKTKKISSDDDSN